MSAVEHDFNGFNDQATEFLKDLGSNNHPAWFHRNRERYDAYVLQPAQALAIALGERLSTLVSGARVEPNIGGSVTDVRVSSPTPGATYAEHIEVRFWIGDGVPESSPAFFMRMGARRLTLGTGIREFAAQALAIYREAVVDPVTGRTLLQALSTVQDNGPYLLCGEQTADVPVGYAPNHERMALLRRTGLYMELEHPIPSNLYTRKFPEYCIAHFRNLLPLHHWLEKQVHPARGLG